MTEHRLDAQDLSLRYDKRAVLSELDLSVSAGSFTVIVGPNACGKSTLLRGLSRMLPPSTGQVLLDGKNITAQSTKDVARHLGLLPQAPSAPGGITVFDLVSRGRYPHQGLLRQWSRADERAVDEAMTAAGVDDLAPRVVDELSGGQRQRAWLAMALAQRTPTLLLDEPTTYLDVAHAVDVLDLCAQLRETQDRTLVVVLHDLNHACRYATDLVVMHEGRVVATGAPEQIVTEELVRTVFGLPVHVIDDPATGGPLVVPRSRRSGGPPLAPSGHEE